MEAHRDAGGRCADAPEFHIAPDGIERVIYVLQGSGA
jgi:hypothetical protein